MNESRVQQSVGLSRMLADFASTFTGQAAPEVVVRNAKLAILDCLGVSIAAVAQETGQATLRFARENAGDGQCTIWGAGRTVGPRDAAFCNGILSHALDFDDRNHSSTFTLAAAMAVAEQEDLTGRRLLEAFIVGREVRNSLDTLFSDRNSGVGPGAKGWHSNGILGSIAAACAAGNALRLNAEQMLDAVGLATGSCGALTRDGGTMAKPFRTGHAAATGLTCVLLAKSGFSADHSALEGRFGLLDALSPIPDSALQTLGKELGHKFHLESGIKVKPLASCTATHSTTEAMFRLRQKHSVEPQSVESIECDLKPYPLVRQHPKRGIEGRFSMPFCLANVLVYGRLDPDDFTDEHVAHPVVQLLMRKTAHVPRSDHLVVKLRDGTALSEALAPPSNFTSIEDISSKFHRCTDRTLTRSRSGEALELLHKLEHVLSVRHLGQLLRSDRRECEGICK